MKMFLIVDGSRKVIDFDLESLKRQHEVITRLFPIVESGDGQELRALSNFICHILFDSGVKVDVL